MPARLPPDAKPASDEEILAAYMSRPEKGLKGAAVTTKLPLSYVSQALKRLGVVSDRRALSGQDGADAGASLDTVHDRQWDLIAGVFMAQKRGVYINKGFVRVYMTISDRERLDVVAQMLGVGELNAFYTNQGKNTQYVYRMAKKEHVKRFLEEMKARLPFKHQWVEAGLEVLNGKAQDSKDGNER